MTFLRQIKNIYWKYLKSVISELGMLNETYLDSTGIGGTFHTAAFKRQTLKIKIASLQLLVILRLDDVFPNSLDERIGALRVINVF